MAGFKKSAVVDALGKTLRDERERSKKLHASQVETVKENNARIREAKKRLESDAKKVANGKLSVEKFAEVLEASTRPRYGHSGDGVYASASLTESEAPKPEESANEKNIDRAICIVKAFDGESISVPQLKELGILGWVKRSWGNA